MSTESIKTKKGNKKVAQDKTGRSDAGRLDAGRRMTRTSSKKGKRGKGKSKPSPNPKTKSRTVQTKTDLSKANLLDDTESAPLCPTGIPCIIGRDPEQNLCCWPLPVAESYVKGDRTQGLIFTNT